MDKNKPHKRIWLLDDYWDGEPCHVWCEDPAPGLDQDPEDAIGPYIYAGDLRKLVEDIRADQYESADVNIWYSDGCKHSADRIEELLKRGE